MIKNKRILILGGAGFIGYHLAKKLEKQGFYIDLIDDLSRGKIDKDFESLIKKKKSDFIILTLTQIIDFFLRKKIMFIYFILQQLSVLGML